MRLLPIILLALASSCASIKPKSKCHYWATLIVFQKPNGEIMYSLNTVKQTKYKNEAEALAKAEAVLREKDFFSGVIITRAANYIPCDCR